MVLTYGVGEEASPYSEASGKRTVESEDPRTQLAMSPILVQAG